MNRFFVFIILCASFILVGAPSHSMAVETLSIAMVDVEKILSESKASKSLQAQIQSKREAFQKEFSAKEKELKGRETTLIQEKEKLSAEEFAKKRKSYEEKIIETRKLFQKRRNGLDSGLNKAMSELRKSIVDAASKVADEKGYDLLLTRESVLIADKKLDVTNEVLKKLDEIQGDIKLSVE